MCYNSFSNIQGEGYLQVIDSVNNWLIIENEFINFSGIIFLLAAKGFGIFNALI